MMKRLLGLAFLLVALLAACSQQPAPDAAQALEPQAVRPNGYVVVLEPGVGNVPAAAADLAQRHGAQVGFVYEHALRGFSITASPQAAAALARNPRVAYVEPDMVMSIAQTTSQVVPTGIRRIFADGNEQNGNKNIGIDGVDNRVDVGVAVIDTGIDWEHPDLNVVGGINCASGSPFRASCSGNGDDDQYHGTHVAGTIAALDNGTGVVGVAPGARLYAVKVLNSQGSGYTSWIIAGIDWVAANAVKEDIRVANMSLGGSGYSQAQYDAIQGAVNKGVAFAVAAGNSNADASGFSPAAFNNVLTVSALADFNGLPGGGAAPTCRQDEDDTLANFSNWGSAVDIAAPGVCILSTYPIEQGSYNTISGTSMASPHAAGALAILASKADYARSASGVATLYNQVIGAGNLNWTDDSGDGIKERLLDVSNATLFAPAMVGGSGGGGGGGGGSTLALTGSSSGGSGGSWTATATLSGPLNASTLGTWSTGASGGCTITSGNSCSFSLTSIPKRVSSVTYTDSKQNLSVTISKP